MKKLGNIVFYASLLAVLYPAATARPADEETVDNPDYAAWAKLKPGDFVKIRLVTTAGQQTTTLEETTKLVSVDKDKVVVEVTSATTAGGKSQQQPASVQTFSAKVPKGSLPELKDVGSENVKAGGKEFNCTIRQVVIVSGQGKEETIGKIWACDKMPGGVVKVQSDVNGRKVEGIVVEFKGAS